VVSGCRRLTSDPKEGEKRRSGSRSEEKKREREGEREAREVVRLEG
jgi:hypothetical protein